MDQEIVGQQPELTPAEPLSPVVPDVPDDGTNSMVTNWRCRVYLPNPPSSAVGIPSLQCCYSWARFDCLSIKYHLYRGQCKNDACLRTMAELQPAPSDMGRPQLHCLDTGYHEPRQSLWENVIK